EGLGTLAMSERRDCRIGGVVQIGAIFPADLPALHIFVAQGRGALHVEILAIGAGERGIFDELHRRVRVAHAEAAFGRLAHHLRPVAVGRRDLLDGGVRGHGCVAGPIVVLAAGEGEHERRRRDADLQVDPGLHFRLSPILPMTGMATAEAGAEAPSLAAIPRASDSRQARSSGSATSRSESPRSAGSGRSDGGAILFCFAWTTRTT